MPGAFAGSVIEVTWGKEMHAPVQYHHFEIGPFKMNLTVGQHETLEQAMERGMAALDAVAKQEFTVKLTEHLSRVRTSAGAAQRRG